MRVLTVVGNRPQFVKAAAVSGRLREVHDECLVHTGQHHDDELSAVFFAELDLPPPDHWLGVSGGANTSQLGRMLCALAPIVDDVSPDAVLVYGDTNSTLAGALAGADGGIPVVHVEAGMRSFDRTMPEERNRVLVDQLSTLLLCPSEVALENLRREAVPGRAEIVGDVMVDVALEVQPRARRRVEPLDRLGLGVGAYVLATAHRAGNVDDPGQLVRLVELLEAVAVSEPVVLPVHPRTRARLEAAGLGERLARAVRVSPPLGYLDFTAVLCNARAVLTDSGGVQKEAYLAGVPCVTLREQTEWVETVKAGWNTLVGLDAGLARTALAGSPPVARPALYGDGRAGQRVVAAIGGLCDER
ncbi:MAG: UDP-GlcNAc3NAcA epimerase [Solirubrobacteraceae bacterium]|jgi:UDP-N-acetylglucosamine 2-epimerase (non-hydrolysing)/UDP-GlcNAc3NAcA epimerase|nr:UDP-GlcNAc3NAcA epimerase [Solirubrobacteraceae bacterium]